MTVADAFRRFFQTDDDGVSEALANCNEVISFSQHPFYPKFLAYLDKEADRMLDTGSEQAVIRSAVRCNTYKEIKAKLRRDVDAAQRAIEREMRDE